MAIIAQSCNSGPCSFLDPNSKSKCLLTGFRIEPHTEYCSKHQSSVEKCEICGKMLVRQGVIIEGPHLICDSCNENIGHCATCTYGHNCQFNADPTPGPQKFIQQQIRQGNTIISQTVRNPAIVEKTCKKCKCYDSQNNQCFRDFTACGQYQIKEF